MENLGLFFSNFDAMSSKGTKKNVGHRWPALPDGIHLITSSYTVLREHFSVNG